LEKKIVLLALILSVCLSLLSLLEAAAPTQAKPDLQKVYNDALSWSKDKLKEMPNTQQSAAIVNSSTIGVCRGQQDDKGELAIAPGCPKKNRTEIEQEHHAHITMNNPKMLVFVSFSMPKASLNALAKEAEKFGAVLGMRGLKGDSFKETQAAFQSLGEEERSGIEINPELFETYKVQQVPVFVKVRTTPEGDLQEIGRLSGNVSLTFAAQKLQDVS
jgi:type-F conjugative transfer system pilin assembly protein TrbC